MKLFEKKMPEFNEFILENDIQQSPEIFYHGMRGNIPFEKFDPRAIGTGIVSNRNNYGGFFFTSEMENAEYYAEYYVAKVKIDNIEPASKQVHSLNMITKQAISDGKNVIVKNILDGSTYSDIVFVPKNNINDVHIIEWVFVGDKEELFTSLDEFFGDGEEVTQYLIRSLMTQMDEDMNFLLTIPEFKEYYESKGEEVYA